MRSGDAPTRHGATLIHERRLAMSGMAGGGRPVAEESAGLEAGSGEGAGGGSVSGCTPPEMRLGREVVGRRPPTRCPVAARALGDGRQQEKGEGRREKGEGRRKEICGPIGVKWSFYLLI
jgi:hypothetical protein